MAGLRSVFLAVDSSQGARVRAYGPAGREPIPGRSVWGENNVQYHLKARLKMLVLRLSRWLDTGAEV